MADLGTQWSNLNDTIYANSPEQSYQAYCHWAATYEDDSNKIQYVGNPNMVKHSIHLIRNEPDSVMLDVAAGTGLTAQAFKDGGFKGSVDGIEVNDEMLKLAQQKGLYRSLFQHKITGEDPLPVKSDSYDFATISGALHTNHLPQDCVRHIVNALKPGGFFIFNSRVTEFNAEYQNILANILQSMVDAKEIVLVEQKEVPHLLQSSTDTGGPIMAQLHIYKKL